MIKVKNISKSFGNFEALKNVSFEVNSGEIIGLLGPNGAGKTTLMRILTGYIPASRGQAFIGGFEIHESPKEAKQLTGYLPEFPPLYLEMRVEDQLKYVAQLKGVPDDKIHNRLEYVLDAVKLTERRKQIIGTLSRGYKQRVGFAQALIHDPEVLILDEPTVGLDPNQIIEIRNLVISLRGQKTIIFSSHILPEVVLSCQRVVVINEGEVVADSDIDELLRQGSPDILAKDLEQSYRASEKIFLNIINREH